MDYSLRDSGIGVIGSIPWGTHIGLLYYSKSDFCGIMSSYVQGGLGNNEMCIWVYAPDTTYEEIKGILGICVRDVDAYLESGQLRIIPHTEWYIEDNSFNEIRVNRRWKELVGYALDNGFDGLRAVADTSWLGKSYFRVFSDYEHNIADIICELPFIAACLYNVDKLDILEVAEIIRNHSYIITGDENSPELIKNVELLIKDKQLEGSEKRYEKLIRLLPVSVFIHDQNRILYCNESAVLLTGVKDSDELLGKPMVDMIPIDRKDSFQGFIKRALEGDAETNCLQSKFLCYNGEVKNVEIVSTGYFFKGYPAVLSVVRDVTPYRRISELKKDIEKKRELLNDILEYDEMKTEFFSNISHELKTPLNVILSAVQLLNLQRGQERQNTKESKYLRMIRQNCLRLLRLVNNLVDINRIDADYFELRPQNCDIVGLVERITMSVVEYATDKGIAIHFASDTRERIVACDPDQVERIILNLISNAIKFTESGGDIWVNIHDRGEKIEISIKDTGIGIPPDKQEYIFDRFRQVDRSFARQHQGSGIGLCLVKALVEKHNGKVTVNSELGKGSQFIIEMPCITLTELENAPCFQRRTDGHSYVERISIEFSDIYSY